jgi:DNA (cytosine-5)-methyltransferase 1
MSIKAFDFFSGCGGTSCGLSMAGMDVVFALDSDAQALETFQTNFPDATVLCQDIRSVDEKILKPLVDSCEEKIIFSGCAPCQPFSRQNRLKTSSDDRKELLLEFGRFIRYWTPDYVLVENVPGLQKISDEGPFFRFLSLLKQLGYEISFGVLAASSFGVPQKRERLVLLASLDGLIELPQPTHGEGLKPFSCVGDWIAGLPPLNAGEVSLHDPDHQCSKLSALNLKRIKSTPEGGGRNDWPEYLKLECHKGHSGHTDVYGRLRWNSLASGLTTRCISLSNGRFGHPEQNRAISVREAACLQTFPMEYNFKGSLVSKAKQIGNAVPPLMAKALGEQVLKSL